MWKSHQCILICILVAAASDQISCDDVDSEILANIRQKRQARNRPRLPKEDRGRNFDEEEYRAKPQRLARNRQLTEPIPPNFVSVLDRVGLDLEGSQDSLLGLGGQPDARPVHQDGSQPRGPVEFNAGRLSPLPDRILSGHQGRPGQQNPRPADPQGFQNPRPRRDNDQFVDSSSDESPRQQNTWPGNLQGFQNPTYKVNNDNSATAELLAPSTSPNTWPGNLQGFQNPKYKVDSDHSATAELLAPSTLPNTWPGNLPGFQNPKYKVDNDHSATAELLAPSTLPNTWPGNLPGFQNPKYKVDSDHSATAELLAPSTSPNTWPGNLPGYQDVEPICRYDQYTCDNNECAHVYARCNGVKECSDGSDEIECYSRVDTEENSSGQGSSFDRTTAAPFGQAIASFTEGCAVPEQPTGGRFELDSCKKPCTVLPGIRVPVGSFLTYRCNEGYSLKGNSVSFCHVDSWYLPPTCVKTCPPLKSNSVDIVCKYHGEIVSCKTAIAPETTATLACKHSYKIPVADDPVYRELTCLENGSWNRALFRCIPECGTSVAHGNILIVNGFTAKIGVFPWHVAIYQEESNKASQKSFTQICAGSLISHDLIISAAHCFYDDIINQVISPNKYAVAAGKHYRDYDKNERYEQKTPVKKIEVASRYYGVSGNFAEDIALVHVKEPFTLTTLVRPICMDWDNKYEREQLQKGQIGKAVGWGKTAEGVSSETLNEVNLPFIPYQECVSAVPEDFRGYVTADKFCAGYLNGTSLCEGDSGGGLGFRLESLWYLRGVASVSPVSGNSCDNHYYTAFTNVARFRDWIRAAYVTT